MADKENGKETQSHTHVIPSVAEESEMPALDSISGFLGRVHTTDFQIAVFQIENKPFSWSNGVIGLGFPDTPNIPRNVSVNAP